MKPQNQAQINTLWADILVEELTRCGVENFCIAPGGRSTSLALAASKNTSAKVFVHQDERGLGFFALGLAKATRKPSVLICTSGTAVANFLPAVVEAYQTAEPLIVLSADLPWEESSSGANQGIDQSRMLADFSQWQFDFPAPGVEFAELDTAWKGLVSKIDYSVFRAAKGPVQLNCRFRSPFFEASLEDLNLSLETETYSIWKSSNQPFTSYQQPVSTPSSKDFAEVLSLLKKAKRGVIVVGQLPVSFNTEIIYDLAEAIKWPVICDPLSQLRLCKKQHRSFISHATIIATDLNYAAETKPDVVLHLGGDIVLRPPNEPFVRGVHRFLNAPEKSRIVVCDSQHAKDPFFDSDLRLSVAVEEFCKLAIDFHSVVPTSSSLPSMIEADEIVAQKISKITSKEMCEPYAVRTVLELLPEDSALFFANSLSIREVDYLLTAKPKGVLCESLHGVKGIDGTFASAFGFAEGLQRPLTLFIGDTAALHDLNSLLLAKKLSFSVVVVLLNNDGGQIFSYVDAAQSSIFEKCFVAPHGCDFSGAANQFGVSYFSPSSLEEVKEQYLIAIQKDGVSILEIKTCRESLLKAQKNIFNYAVGV